MTLPPFADGTQNDAGMGLTIDDGKARAVIKADSAQLSATGGWTLSGDVYNYKGGLVFEPLTSSGNLAIGYGMKAAGSGQLNLYGNSVAVSCNSGGFLKVVSGSKSYSLAKDAVASYTIDLNGGTGWTLVGVTRITSGSKHGMIYGWNVNTYTGTAEITVHLRNLNESSKLADSISVETVWIHATL